MVQLRSDRGTNFVGACKELDMNTDDTTVRKYLTYVPLFWDKDAPGFLIPLMLPTWAAPGRDLSELPGAF